MFKGTPGAGRLKETTLDIAGMSCAACAGRVEKALSGVRGVEEAKINLAAAKATVRYNPAIVGEPDLVKAVEKSGYRAAVK